MSTLTLTLPREAVLRRVKKSPLKPTGLLADLGNDYSYSEIQDALSNLLETGDVILTSHLILEPANSKAIAGEE